MESQQGYEDTVPANVRLINEDKVRSQVHPLFRLEFTTGLQRKTFEAEVATLEQSKEMFERLK